MVFGDVLLVSYPVRVQTDRSPVSGRANDNFSRHAFTPKKNTLEMNKVKRKIPGRPRRSQNQVGLHALGQRIRQLRGDITQEDFARSLGISQAQLSKYELGQSALPLGSLVKLAQKSGRTTDWILTGKS
jgi:DNA-binding transcriptional regulator YiaG